MLFRRDENMQGKSFVQRVLDQDRLIRPDGPPDRVQHQKQILGVFGTIRIEDDIPDDAKGSPFRPGTYLAAFRFSNGQPVTAPDQKADVRGIAVKYFVGGQEVDLLATVKAAARTRATPRSFWTPPTLSPSSPPGT